MAVLLIPKPQDLQALEEMITAEASMVITVRDVERALACTFPALKYLYPYSTNMVVTVLAHAERELVSRIAAANGNRLVRCPNLQIPMLERDPLSDRIACTCQHANPAAPPVQQIIELNERMHYKRLLRTL